jgi:sterol desaturase/sphingolipid hydroxylase (fatty acid hydroxylase superfamily)
MVDNVLHTSAAPQSRHMARRIAPFLAFALLMALGYALRASEGMREALRERLTDLVRLGLSSGDLAHLLETVAAGIGLLVLVTGQGLIAILVLLAIESALAGPPRRWSTVSFALGLQTLTVLFYFFAGPFIGRALPWDLGIGPLLVLGDGALPDLLRPAIPFLGAILLLLFMTFGSYWAHRALHRFPFLWRFHAVHHSVEDMDAANSYVHPVDVLVERTALIALGLVLKVDFDTFIWVSAFTAFYDRLIHSRCPIHFGFLRHVLIDNRHHFIHHSRDAAHYDRNFGSYFSVWDRLFGTYLHPESDKLMPTGLADRMPPAGVWQFATAQLEPRAQGQSQGE